MTHLLVPRVLLADYIDSALPPYNVAAVAHGLDRGAHFHAASEVGRAGHDCRRAVCRDR